LRYRPHKASGEVVEAYGLTDFPARRLSSRTLFQLATSRWEIENQGFNDAKNRHGLEHICHHHPNSLLLTWLLIALALTIERLYRLRYLPRGSHPVRLRSPSSASFASASPHPRPWTGVDPPLAPACRTP
jgi:hypothetical protein